MPLMMCTRDWSKVVKWRWLTTAGYITAHLLVSVFHSLPILLWASCSSSSSAIYLIVWHSRMSRGLHATLLNWTRWWWKHYTWDASTSCNTTLPTISLPTAMARSSLTKACLWMSLSSIFTQWSRMNSETRWIWWRQDANRRLPLTNGGTSEQQTIRNGWISKVTPWWNMTITDTLPISSTPSMTSPRI